MIGTGLRHAYRLRTGLPGATAGVVLATAFEVAAWWLATGLRRRWVTRRRG